MCHLFENNGTTIDVVMPVAYLGLPDVLEKETGHGQETAKCGVSGNKIKD